MTPGRFHVSVGLVLPQLIGMVDRARTGIPNNVNNFHSLPTSTRAF
jgi:hypothetical protein